MNMKIIKNILPLISIILFSISLSTYNQVYARNNFFKTTIVGGHEVIDLEDIECEVEKKNVFLECFLNNIDYPNYSSSLSMDHYDEFTIHKKNIIFKALRKKYKNYKFRMTFHGLPYTTYNFNKKSYIIRGISLIISDIYLRTKIEAFHQIQIEPVWLLPMTKENAENAKYSSSCELIFKVNKIKVNKKKKIRKIIIKPIAWIIGETASKEEYIDIYSSHNWKLAKVKADNQDQPKLNIDVDRKNNTIKFNSKDDLERALDILDGELNNP